MYSFKKKIIQDIYKKLSVINKIMRISMVIHKFFNAEKKEVILDIFPFEIHIIGFRGNVIFDKAHFVVREEYFRR